ncbi:mechanosensitive ion channel family protein [Peribacillus sp. SCS-155]|uniref:mechanosensitive ion channel family protein n=1 Tax=Peribacillus sedimenti TaxID=3115297 RepID=UPI0039062EBC
MKYINKLNDKISSFFFDEETWATIGEAAFKILLVIIISSLFIRVGKTIIRKFFLLREKSPLRVSERREATLLKLLQNILRYVIFFISFVMILEILGINVSGLLAGAGIVGLAVGFGAQSLVKDIITGFFIILEDQFSVGDYVRISQFEGEVLEIGLRTTKIKSTSGELHVIPNGSILEVTNFSILNSVAMVDVSIPYDMDLELAERVIAETLEGLSERYEDMVKPPELLGIQSLGPSEVVFRIVSEVKPMRHWYIGRVLRKEVKANLSKHGIEGPVPRMVMYNRLENQDKVQQQKQSE